MQRKSNTLLVKAFNMEVRHLIKIWDQLMVKVVLYCVFIGRVNYESHLMVPQILQETVLAELHEGSTGGNLSQSEKTLGKLNERFY